jgi:hypothetical protein
MSRLARSSLLHVEFDEFGVVGVGFDELLKELWEPHVTTQFLERLRLESLDRS